jgi:serine/threonine-protein kinase HipA
MIAKYDFLEVGYEDSIVGKLAFSPDHLAVFEYEPEFLKSGFSISPFYLPLKPGVFIGRREPFNGLFGVFNDSLPDGWGMLLTDRLLKKQKINPEQLTPLDRLSLVGNNGMGALTYKPATTFSHQEGISDLNLLADEVKQVLHSDYNGSVENLYQKGGTSGGARPKVLITIDTIEWLVKFQGSSDPNDIGQLEYKYAEVAGKCGIEMPETRLFEGKYFGTRRFDREENRRYHIHSASGLLYASFRYPSLDYTELIKATMALTRNIMEAWKVFRLMVFNVLTCNRDDHAKNFSFIWKNGEWALSPAYDLVFSTGFNGQHTTTIGGKGNPSKADIFEVAKVTGLPVKTARTIFEEVYEGCREIRKVVL